MYYKNNWVVSVSHDEMVNDPKVHEIASELNVTLPTAQLLVNRGCGTSSEARSFLAKEEEQLHDPFVMLDMDIAAERIASAIEDGEKIVDEIEELYNEL